MGTRGHLGCVLLLAALSCGPAEKSTRPAGPGPGSLVPIATPPGAPLAPEPQKAAVTSEGGSFAVDAGALTVSVPAGAVTAPTELTVLPIANTARGAVGPAFRLGPEGKVFEEPVTLTFQAPAQYPSGTSIADIGVEYQDAHGFWRRVEPVTRNEGANTVSVQTSHFSDWALTWQGATAAAEGEITLVQRIEDPYGVPFTATGTATLYFQQDTATDTYYTLTGTLTVPATIPWGAATCVPDQTTKTLPLNLAEVHKGTPPVFRWGLGVSWKLACSDGTTPDMPALFDTMYINPPLCPGDYAAGQIVSSTQVAGRYWKDCGQDGTLEVDATWDLQACVEEMDCSAAECRVGLTACTEGHQSCVETGFAPNGSTCGTGPGQVCSEGQCVDPNDPGAGVTVTPTARLVTTEAGGTATFQVSLGAQPTTTVTIALSTTDSTEGTVSPASVSFGPLDWDVAQVVTVTGANDAVDDGDQTYAVVTAPCVSADPRYDGRDPVDVEATNQDDDAAGIVVFPTSGLETSEAGGQATFTVVLTSQPGAAVTVPLSTSSAEGTVSASSVSFGPLDWDVAQVVTVTGANDDGDDGDKPYAVVTGVAGSADPLYDGINPPDVQVTNVDDDAAGIVVSPTSGLQTTEAGGQATFTIAVSSRPTATVTIALSTSSAEGTVSPASVSFGPSDWSAKTVTVTGADDDVDDGDRGYAVVTGVAESTDLGYAGRDPADVQLTNVDDDAAGIVVSPASGLVTTEAGGQAAFTIVLASEPTSVVTVAVSTSSPEGTLSAASVAFGPGDWDVAQVVTVTGADDDVDDGDQDYAVVTGAAASADPLYGGVNPDDVQVRNLDDDSAGFVVTPTAGLETTEGGGQASFTIVLTSQPTADVTVPVVSSNPDEGTVSPDSVTFTFLDWSVPQTVTVTGAQDAAVDGPQAYFVLTGPAQTSDAAYLGLDPDDVQVTNLDDDSAGIVVSPTSGLQTSEAGGQAPFTIVLTSQPTATVTIALSTSSAEGTVSPTSVSFGPADWDVAQIVTVTGANDAVDDGDQTYSVVTGAADSGDPLYAGINPPDVQVTNVDDDTAGIFVSPTAGLQTSEASGQATFTIILTTRPAEIVTVPLSTNSAEGTVSVASVSFGPLDWDVAQIVTVTGVNDEVDDGDRAYAVVTGVAVSADPLYAGMNPPDVQVTNVDDDAAGIVVSPTSGLETTEAGGQATFTVVLTSQPTAAVTISLSSSSTEGTVSAASVSFGPLDWDVAQVVTVTGANDDLDDGDRAYTVVTGPVTGDPLYAALDPADVQVTSLDDDAAGIVVSPTSGLQTTEAGGQATFTIVLTSEPRDTVTVPLSTSSAEGTVSPTAVIFGPADWDVAQVVTVTGADDDVDDGDQPYAVLTGAAVSADPGYSGREVDDVQVTNLDDDSAGIVVSPTTGLATTETGGQASFTIVLTSQPAVDVIIPLSSSDTGEGTVSPDSVTFTSLNWNVAQTVTVTGVQDAGVIDGPQPYLVLTGAAETADAAYFGLNADDVQVSNVDDDSIGIVVSPTSGLQTTEAGGQATFTVVMTSQPAATVTVPLSTSSAEGTVSPASLSFGALDWDVAQVVTVTGANDGVDDGDRPYTVVTGVAESADPSYGGVIDPADVEVTNVDDDTATILVSPTTGLQTSEAGGQATFTIVLTSQPTADVTVPLSTNSAEGTVSPASATFGPLDWDVAQVVTVSGADDDVDDGDRAYAIVTGAAVSGDPSYGGRDPADVQVTNLDDDAAGIFVTPTSGLQTSEGGGQATFTIVLTSQPTATVTVPLSTSSAEGTVSPVSVAIDPLDWDVPHVVTVTGANDDVDDGNRAYSVLTGVAESADSSYGGVIDPADVQLTNLDDDTAGVVVSPTSGLVTSEAGGHATFTVVLASQPTASVTVPLSTGSAEGTVSAASVAFGPADWDVAQVVTVTGANDDVDDGDQDYEVVTGAAVSSDPLYGGVNPFDVQVRNLDDDSAGVVVTPATGLETTEEGGQASFTIVLTSQPTADVTIPLSSSDTGEGTVSPDSVTFTFANWDVAQIVTVTGVQDTGAADGPQPYLVLTDPAQTSDVAYLDLDADDVQVTNLDDDASGIAVAPTSGLVTTEAGGQATFTIVLTSQPTDTVTVPLSTSSAEGTVSPASVTFGPADWDVAQVVTVTGANDEVGDGNQAYTVVTGAAVSADPGYAGRDPADVQVTNLDDDTAGIFVWPTAGLQTSEAGQQATFTIVLTSEPTADVTVPLRSGNPDEGTVSPDSVTFTLANWSIPQPVTVTGVQDAGALDGPQDYLILTDPAQSADTAYLALDPEDVQVRNLDDDPQS